MTNPIAITADLTGEAAVLLSPPDPDATPKFDPSSPADYKPPEDTETPVLGFPEGKQMWEGMDERITGAFTISISSKPPGLQAEASKLVWRGDTRMVISFRERSFLGVINGYTLFLAV